MKTYYDFIHLEVKNSVQNFVFQAVLISQMRTKIKKKKFEDSC